MPRSVRADVRMEKGSARDREPADPAARNPSMADRHQDKANESPRDRCTTAMLLTAVVFGGGFATVALLKGAWDLLRRYGGL